MLANKPTLAKEPDHYPPVVSSDFKRTFCPIDSTANAFVIVDEGSMSIDIKEFLTNTYRRHIRYHILNDAALDLGNFEIVLSKYRKEKIIGFKATTYVLENGEVVAHSFAKKDILYEDLNEFIETAKIPMPAVRANCIIDIEYSLLSDVSASVRPWCFQSNIPTLDSYYTFECPKELGFNQNITGAFLIDYEEIKNNGENKIKLHGKNLIAFPELPFLTTSDNFISKYEIEIFEYLPPFGQRITFSKTWNDVFQTLSESECFGAQLKKTKFLSATVQNLISKQLSKEDLLEEAILAVTNKMSVDNTYELCYGKDIETCWNKQYGNPTAINIILIVLLRELGFDSSPLLLSTRKHGYLNPNKPTLDCFNYAITYINLNGNHILIDASAPNAKYNLLPSHCLNDLGLVFDKDMDKWIVLDCHKTYKTNKVYKLKLDENGTLDGEAVVDYYDFGILSFQNKMAGLSSSQEICKQLESETKGWHIINIAPFQPSDSTTKSFRIRYELELREKLESQENIILFDCMLALSITDNPLLDKSRLHPVEFLYPSKELVSLEIDIPKSYKVVQIPKNILLKTDNGEATYTLSVSQLESKIIITSIVNITEKYFDPSKYEELKSYFDFAVSKCKEQIILSKI